MTLLEREEPIAPHHPEIMGRKRGAGEEG